MLDFAPINRCPALMRAPLPRALAGVALMIAITTLVACKPEETSAVVVETAPAAQTETATAPVVTPSPTAASGAAALIGMIVPPYPDGLEEASGSCVAGGEGLERVCDFGVATIGNRAASGEVLVRYLLLSRNTDTAAKQPQWEVTDAVDAPTVDAGYDLQIADCRLNGADASSLVAVVRHGDSEYSSDVTWARRFDTATGKFSVIPLEGVDCVNPGAGI